MCTCVQYSTIHLCLLQIPLKTLFVLTPSYTISMTGSRLYTLRQRSWAGDTGFNLPVRPSLILYTESCPYCIFQNSSPVIFADFLLHDLAEHSWFHHMSSDQIIPHNAYKFYRSYPFSISNRPRIGGCHCVYTRRWTLTTPTPLTLTDFETVVSQERVGQMA